MGFSPDSLLVYRRNNLSTTVSNALQSQGVPSLAGVTTDWWSNLTSGVVVDGSCGGGAGRSKPLQRTSATTLAQYGCSTVEVRARVLAERAPDIGSWLRKLGSIKSSDPVAHARVWAAFWDRSYIQISRPPSKSDPPTTDPESEAELEVETLPSTAPVAGMALWLQADAISGVADGAKLSTWSNSAPTAAPGAASAARQSNISVQPTYLKGGNVSAGKPAVRFT
jgi:hypothetical protein